MPRFRAMSPVRTDFGVHLLAVEVEDSASAAALFTAVVWSALHRGRAERVPKDHSLSMAEEAEGLWWQRQPETRLNFVRLRCKVLGRDPGLACTLLCGRNADLRVATSLYRLD